MAKAKNGFTEKRKKELVLLGVALIAIIGVSFAWLTLTVSSTNSNVIVAGNLLLTLSDSSQVIKIDSSTGYGAPISDQAGLQTTPYTFTIENTGKVPAKYKVYLDDVSAYDYYINQTRYDITSNTPRIDDSKIDCNIRVGNSDTNTTVNKLSTLGSPRTLVDATAANAVLNPGQSRTYYLRLWIDKDAVNADVEGKVFVSRIRIEATQTQNSNF